MKKTLYLTSILFLFHTCTAVAQEDSLRQRIEQIALKHNADIGVSISGIESNDTLSINGNKNYPILSVFKFHIALTVLNKIDRKEFSLTQKIFIKKSDLLSNTLSPIRDKYPGGNVWLSLADILTYTVSQSDTTVVIFYYG